MYVYVEFYTDLIISHIILKYEEALILYRFNLINTELKQYFARKLLKNRIIVNNLLVKTIYGETKKCTVFSFSFCTAQKCFLAI